MSPGGTAAACTPRVAAALAAVPAPVIRRLGRVEYEPTWRAMQKFTDGRDPSTPDEIWLLQHPPVFTLGLNASRAPASCTNSPSACTVSPHHSLRRASVNSRTARTGFSTARPDSARKSGLPVPTAIAAQPGAASSSVAMAMAVGIGCQRYGLTAVGTSTLPGTLIANAMQVAIASR